MAPKTVTNEILDVKLDTVKERLNSHIEEEGKVFNDLYRILEKTDSRIDNIDVTLAKQHAVLEEHIRRTEVLEATVVPIKAKSDLLGVLLKIAGTVGGLGAGGFGIKELVKFFLS